VIDLKWCQQRSCSINLVGQVRVKDHFKEEIRVRREMFPQHPGQQECMLALLDLEVDL
jgi:hypothetical protein